MVRLRTALPLLLVLAWLYLYREFGSTWLSGPLLRPTPVSVHEDLLARGMPVPLSEADLFTLTMLLGLSDNRAAALLNNREQLLELGRQLPLDRHREAYLTLRGVGPKNAAELAANLILK